MQRFLILVVLIAISNSRNFSNAEEAKVDKGESELIERLDKIMTRLAEIERRLSKIESATRVSAKWTIDEKGMMRFPDGRTLGFWGVDLLR